MGPSLEKREITVHPDRPQTAHTVSAVLSGIIAILLIVPGYAQTDIRPLPYSAIDLLNQLHVWGITNLPPYTLWVPAIVITIVAVLPWRATGAIAHLLSLVMLGQQLLLMYASHRSQLGRFLSFQQMTIVQMGPVAWLLLFAATGLVMSTLSAAFGE